MRLILLTTIAVFLLTGCETNKTTDTTTSATPAATTDTPSLSQNTPPTSRTPSPGNQRATTVMQANTMATPGQ